jgi:hypothetical protein
MTTASECSICAWLASSNKEWLIDKEEVVIRTAPVPGAATHLQIIPRVHADLRTEDSKALLRYSYAQALEITGCSEDVIIGVLNGDSAHTVLQIMMPPFHKMQMHRYNRFRFTDAKEYLQRPLRRHKETCK